MSDDDGYMQREGDIRQEKILITAGQCRAARAIIKMTQPKLAAAAGLGLSTVLDFETDKRAVSRTAILAIQRALEAAGVVFLRPDVSRGEGVAVALKS